MSVQFEDFSVQVNNAIESAALQWLEEAASEIESAAKRNSRKAEGNLKGSWNHSVNSTANEAQIGSPLENAIWEEFGTGEYAANGDGRKGGWYVPEEKLSSKAKAKMRKTVIKGKVFYHTYGKTPNHTLQRAFDSKKNAVINLAKQIFGDRLT